MFRSMFDWITGRTHKKIMEEALKERDAAISRLNASGRRSDALKVNTAVLAEECRQTSRCAKCVVEDLKRKLA